MGTSFFETLTPQEQRKPYARFIDRPYREPRVPVEMGKKLSAPMDPGLSLQIEDLNLLLDPTYNGDDMGYCLQADGTGYVSQTLHFEGAKREMFLWWFSWHGHESLRYRIWDPNSHKEAHASPRHIRQRLDSGLGMQQRFENTTNFTVHLDSYGNPDPGCMSFVPPKNYGFNMNKYDPSRVSLVCAVNGKGDSPFPWYSSLRVLTDTPTGFMMRIYFWYGKVMFNGHIIKVPHSLTSEALYTMAVHVGEEYNRLADILPEVYEQNSTIQDCFEDFIPVDI